MTVSTLPTFSKGGAEQRAIEAGEIDAIIDYASSNVILLPAAKRALRDAATRDAVAGREAMANSLLAALPRAEYLRLSADLEAVSLRAGEILQEPGALIRHLYFPIDCAICLLAPVVGHPPPVVGLVGYEGMVGLSLALGVDRSTVRAVVQASGTALRMKTASFQEAFGRCPSLQREIYRYTHAKLALARQGVACNCFHAVDARLSRWLLITSDRVRSNEFFLTQSVLADLLGVQRTTLNQASGSLRRRGLINSRRGWITIRNRNGLEAASCACYARIEPRVGDARRL